MGIESLTVAIDPQPFALVDCGPPPFGNGGNGGEATVLMSSIYVEERKIGILSKWEVAGRVEESTQGHLSGRKFHDGHWVIECVGCPQPFALVDSGPHLSGTVRQRPRQPSVHEEERKDWDTEQVGGGGAVGEATQGEWRGGFDHGQWVIEGAANPRSKRTREDRLPSPPLPCPPTGLTAPHNPPLPMHPPIPIPGSLLPDPLPLIALPRVAFDAQTVAASISHVVPPHPITTTPISTPPPSKSSHQPLT